MIFEMIYIYNLKKVCKILKVVESKVEKGKELFNVKRGFKIE